MSIIRGWIWRVVAQTNRTILHPVRFCCDTLPGVEQQGTHSTRHISAQYHLNWASRCMHTERQDPVQLTRVVPILSCQFGSSSGWYNLLLWPGHNINIFSYASSPFFCPQPQARLKAFSFFIFSLRIVIFYHLHKLILVGPYSGNIPTSFEYSRLEAIYLLTWLSLLAICLLIYFALHVEVALLRM